MSAVAIADAGRGWEDAGHGVRREDRVPDAVPAQPRLFALPGGAVAEPAARTAAPAPAVAPSAAPPVAAAPVRSLEEVLVAAWSTVTAGGTARCPVCAGPLRPRPSAGAGAAGGRCGDCGTCVA